MPEHHHWLLAEAAHIATLTLNRPAANNSLTPETLSESGALTAHLRAGQDIWAIVVQGQSEHFPAGVESYLAKREPHFTGE